MPADFGAALRALTSCGARFVVVGGFAVMLHGASYLTLDLDIAFERTRENAKKIAAALAPFSPRPRGFPKELPFVFDEQTVLSAQMLTLSTAIGDIDLLGELPGIGGFREVEAQSDAIDYDEMTFSVLSVDALIVAKRTANRPKDQPGLVELAALKEARALLDADAEAAAVPPGGSGDRSQAV